jgi:hypothetical protein
MFADYKGKQYKIVREEGKWNLISMNPDSEKYGFEKDEDIYYKEFDDISEFDDVYELTFFVLYDTHLDKVPTEWSLNLSNGFFKEDSVKLLFAEGILPGWKVEDKNVCSTYIKNEDISQAWTIKESIITNSVEKEIVNPNELYSMYRRLISL